MKARTVTFIVGAVLAAPSVASAQVTVSRGLGDGSNVMTVSAFGPGAGAPEPTGTASIRGRVVAVETGVGLKNVQVRLTGGGFREGRTVGTDAEGRYEIDNLPAGRFTLNAAKTGYVSLSY